MTDETFAAALADLGERGLVDLIGGVLAHGAGRRRGKPVDAAALSRGGPR